MIKFTVFGDLHYDEVSDGEKRVNELVEHIDAAKPVFRCIIPLAIMKQMLVIWKQH